jgi:Mg2+ and Co2+ transporter CorA
LNFESIFFKELREKVMSIQMLAQELYRLLKKVEKIENQLENAPPEKKEEIKDKLRKISAERNRIRAALDGRIDRQSKHHIK